VRVAVPDPAAERRGSLGQSTVETMLREPRTTRTPLKWDALERRGLLKIELQKMEDLAR
jgi:hypothetical protein